MGGFLYYDKRQISSDTVVQSRSLEALERKKLSDGRSLILKEVIEKDGFVIYLYEKIGVHTENILHFPVNDFILNTGTLIYKKQTGAAALKALYADFEADTIEFNSMQGQFCIFIYKNNKLYTWNDFIGVYHVFCNENYSVISSSFLSVVRLLKTKQVDVQAMHEYICSGASYNNDTYIKGVKLLDAFNVHMLSPEKQRYRKVNSISVIYTDDFNERVELTADKLLDYFMTLKSCFGDQMCSALSGGYDSRLILSILSKINVDPYLYVYGGEKSADVRVANAIAEAENLKIHHDARKADKPSIEHFQDLVQHEYFYCDGHGPGGVFTNGTEFSARTVRTNAAKLQLNGGGGEIFRNFWKLPNRSISIDDFLKSRFDVFPDIVYKDNFNSEEYLLILKTKIQQMLEIEKQDLTRVEVEKLYVYMRIKYWMGYNTSIQNVRSYALIPLTEPVFAFSSFAIPFKQKEAGIFEAALINRISPKLAAYDSAYGYNFSTKPPVMAEIKNLLAVNLPVTTRRFLRQYKYHLLSKKTPFYLQQDYINSVIPEKASYMQEYFNFENIRDPLMLSRLHTINLVLADPF